jgi:hypothetical protein
MEIFKGWQGPGMVLDIRAHSLTVKKQITHLAVGFFTLRTQFPGLTPKILPEKNGKGPFRICVSFRSFISGSSCLEECCRNGPEIRAELMDDLSSLDIYQAALKSDHITIKGGFTQCNTFTHTLCHLIQPIMLSLSVWDLPGI